MVTPIMRRCRLTKRTPWKNPAFQAFLDATTVGFALHEMIFDAEGNPVDYRYLMINPGLEQLIGARASDMVGRTVLELYPGVEPHWIGPYAEVVRTGQPMRLRNYIPAVGRHCEISVYRPAPGQFACSVTDVTSYVEAEEALRESERRIVEATHVGTWEWSIPTGEVVLNGRWAEIAGYALHELGPISIQTWKGLAHPDDLPHSDQQLRKHFSGELPYYDIECRMRHREGHWVWVNARGRVTHWASDGKPLQMVGTHTDISERKRMEEDLRISEERFRLATEATHAMVYDVDVFSGRVNALYGLTQLIGDAPDWSGLSFRSLGSWIHPDDTQYVREAFLGTVRSGGDHQLIFRVRHSDGSYRFVEEHARAIRNEAGLVARLVGTVVDTTERETAKQSLEGLTASRAEFLATCAHELKTPLTVLLGNVGIFQLMFESLHASARSRFLASTVAQCKKLDRIVTDLLDVSRLESGQLTVVLTPTPLDELVLHTVESFTGTCQTHVIRVSELAICSARVDRLRFEQMLLNLLTNAAKYSDGGSTITVGLSCCGDSALVSVADEGCGIPEEDSGKLFERYYRHPSSGAASGMGIGLYLTSQLALLHGGTVTVDSTVGWGSTFSLRVPLGDLSETDSARMPVSTCCGSGPPAQEGEVS